MVTELRSPPCLRRHGRLLCSIFAALIWADLPKEKKRNLVSLVSPSRGPERFPERNRRLLLFHTLLFGFVFGGRRGGSEPTEAAHAWRTICFGAGAHQCLSTIAGPTSKRRTYSFPFDHVHWLCNSLFMMHVITPSASWRDPLPPTGFSAIVRRGAP